MGILVRIPVFFGTPCTYIFRGIFTFYFQSSTRRKWTAGVKSITNLRAFSSSSTGAGAGKRDSAADSGVGGSAEEVVEAVTIREENQVTAKF